MLWGLLALLLGRRAFGPDLWLGLLAAPIVGILIGHVFQTPFAESHGWRRGLLALGSLYSSATLFGLAIGVAEWIRVPTGPRSVLAMVTDPVLAVWWGITLTSFILFLWPLAYFTHWVIERTVEHRA